MRKVNKYTVSLSRKRFGRGPLLDAGLKFLWDNKSHIWNLSKNIFSSIKNRFTKKKQVPKEAEEILNRIKNVNVSV